MDDVLLIVARYNQVFSDLISKTESIERQYGTKDEIRNLLSDLAQEKSSTEELIEKIKRSSELKLEEVSKSKDYVENLEKQVVSYEKRIEQLEADLQEVRNELQNTNKKLKSTESEIKETKSELKEMKLALQTGQLAYDFEKDLAKYIYPKGKDIGSRKIFTTMLKWLKESKETEERREANEKWDKLKEKFSWSSDHENVFFKMIKTRLPIAHQKFELETFQSQSPDSFYSEKETQCIKDIHDMYDEVNDLIMKQS